MVIPQREMERLTQLYDSGIVLVLHQKDFEIPVTSLIPIATQQPLYIGGYLINHERSLYVLSDEREPSPCCITPASAKSELSFTFTQEKQKQGFTLSQMMKDETPLGTRWNLTLKDQAAQVYDFFLYERWNPGLLNNNPPTPLDPIKLLDFHNVYNGYVLNR